MITIPKEQICHDLAIEYAKVEAQKEYGGNELLGQFEYNERLLCIYSWCYNDLYENYGSILKRYKDLRDEMHSS